MDVFNVCHAIDAIAIVCAWTCSMSLMLLLSCVPGRVQCLSCYCYRVCMDVFNVVSCYCYRVCLDVCNVRHAVVIVCAWTCSMSVMLLLSCVHGRVQCLSCYCYRVCLDEFNICHAVVSCCCHVHEPLLHISVSSVQCLQTTAKLSMVAGVHNVMTNHYNYNVQTLCKLLQ